MDRFYHTMIILLLIAFISRKSSKVSGFSRQNLYKLVFKSSGTYFWEFCWFAFFVHLPRHFLKVLRIFCFSSPVFERKFVLFYLAFFFLLAKTKISLWNYLFMSPRAVNSSELFKTHHLLAWDNWRHSTFSIKTKMFRKASDQFLKYVKIFKMCGNSKISCLHFNVNFPFNLGFWAE